LVAGNRFADAAACWYPQPSAAFAPSAGHLAFFASHVNACWVGDEPVPAQAGNFYGGWITAQIVGPFKS